MNTRGAKFDDLNTTMAENHFTNSNRTEMIKKKGKIVSMTVEFVFRVMSIDEAYRHMTMEYDSTRWFLANGKM